MYKRQLQRYIIFLKKGGVSKMKTYEKLYYKTLTIQIIERAVNDTYIILENEGIKKELPLKYAPGCGYTYQLKKTFLRTEYKPERLHAFYKTLINENFGTLWIDALIKKYFESEV